MNNLQKLSGLQKDYLISHMQAQLNTLKDVLFNLQHSEYLQRDYVDESLKELERTVHMMRKINLSN